MSHGVEENTLGVIVGRENLPRRDRSFRRPQRTVTTTRANQHALGGRHLGVGSVVAGVLLAAFLFLLFAMEVRTVAEPLLSWLAWTIIGVIVAAGIAAVRALAGRMPTWLFATTLAGGIVVIILDEICSWGQADGMITATAALAVPVLLLAMVTLRETTQIIIADAGFGIILLVCAILEDRADPLTFAPDFVAIALAVGAPFLGVAVVRSYRRMVQLELDLALVQSTVQAPRLAVGMIASEELTRLDDDAEELLVAVADGSLAIPLPTEAANRAASLATSLRLHLIEGRKETWLRHAIAESEFLAPAVTVDDPSSLAGILQPDQRDALLRVIWLLVSETERFGATLHLRFGPALPPTPGSYHAVRYPLVLESTGVAKRRVDSAAWDAMGIVGPHVDSMRDGSLRVEIDCRVENLSDT